MHRAISEAAFALAFFTSLALSLYPAPALANAIAPGDRVRIKYEPKQSVSGTVVSCDGRGYVVHPDGASDNTTVETSAVRSLERLEGVKSCWAKGMLIGGMVGLIGGAVASSVDNGGGFADPGNDAAYLLAFPVAGAALGGLIGAFIKTEKWQDVPLSGLEVGVISGDARGVAVSWNLRF